MESSSEKDVKTSKLSKYGLIDRAAIAFIEQIQKIACPSKKNTSESTVTK